MKRNFEDYATKKELLNSIDSAFSELTCSKYFSKFAEDDRRRIVFHWQLLRDEFSEN